MNREEIVALLEPLLPRESRRLDGPSEGDWAELSRKFDCNFDADFKHFIELMSDFQFPGDIFNVARRNTNGNDHISLVFDMEVKNAGWDPDMIPFYGIGNGDYFCLSRSECPLSGVYYFYAEKRTFEKYCGSFGEWLKQLPQFLA